MYTDSIPENRDERKRAADLDRSIRRDYFAAAALSGLLASRGPEYGMFPDMMAADAVKCADALLLALDATKDGEPSNGN